MLSLHFLLEIVLQNWWIQPSEDCEGRQWQLLSVHRKPVPGWGTMTFSIRLCGGSSTCRSCCHGNVITVAHPKGVPLWHPKFPLCLLLMPGLLLSATAIATYIANKHKKTQSKSTQSGRYLWDASVDCAWSKVQNTLKHYRGWEVSRESWVDWDRAVADLLLFPWLYDQHLAQCVSFPGQQLFEFCFPGAFVPGQLECTGVHGMGT